MICEYVVMVVVWKRGWLWTGDWRRGWLRYAWPM